LDGSRVTTIFEGNTGAQGLRHGSFSVPSDWSGGHLIRASVSGLGETLEVSTAIEKTLGILIETDKPIYKPGQTILGRILLLNSALKPVSEEVEVTFHDAKGLRIARQTLIANDFGVAPFSLDLANEVNFGTWKVKALSGTGESVCDVRVEEYVLPRFDLSVSFPKQWALVDESIQGTVEAAYFFGQPVVGTVKVTARRWVGVWEEYHQTEGSFSGGEFNFTLPAVNYVSGTPESGQQGSVVVEVTATDATGNEQSTSEILTITQAAGVITLLPVSEYLKPELANPLLVQCKTPEGVPIEVDVSVEAEYYGFDGSWLGGQDAAVTTSGGIGQLGLNPPQETAYAEVSAESVIENRSAQTEIRIGGAYSPANSFLSLSMLTPDPAELGQIAGFSVVSTTGGTVFYEVFAAGRTILSDFTETDTFSFTVTPEMLPKAKVVAYQVDPNNEVVADSYSFDVNLSVSLSVNAKFDPASVKPGDPVELILDAGTGQETLLGVSVVDESVLALGRSRLHLAEVFDELERRFVEPQIEVHEGGDEPGPFPGGFWAPVQTPGTLDVLHDAGLEVDASAGVWIPEGGWMEGFWDVPVSPPSGGGGAETAAPNEPKVRQYFPETWVWEPTLLTDDTGKAKLTLTAPDNITGWKLSVVSSFSDTQSDSPGIGFGEADLVAFQEFFVEPSLPYSVVRGETFTARVDVFNYLDQAQQVRLTLRDSPGFALLDQKEVSVTVPPGSSLPVYFEIQPLVVGTVPFQLEAIADSASDAILRQLNVVPEGLPMEHLENGVIRPDEKTALEPINFPGAIQDSQRAFLYLSASPVAQTMSGAADLLGMPYGCGEQNMIFLAPDIEILKYLREIQELVPEVRAEAEYFINVGYQRQLTFQTEEGGFAAFGGREASLWLTAFVLSTFSGAREVRDIDETVLTRAAAMLISRQLEDGSFETDDFLIHKEMDGGLENIYAMAAYTTNALAEYADQSVTAALEKAAGYLISNASTVWDDPYSLSIASVALFRAGYDSAAEEILDRLLELAIDGESGLHWEPYPVETTGYAALGLLMADEGEGRPEGQSAIEWLSSQRNSLGGYGGSTQDTVVALRAMFQAARQVRRDLNVELTVWRGDQLLAQLLADETNFDLLQQLELPTDQGTLELRSKGTGSVSYQWVQRYNIPGLLLPPSRDMKLDVVYGAAHIEVDDLVDVEVTLEYTGLKETTGMVILDVGVPTGFEAEKKSLQILVEEEVVERSETAGRKVIFYIGSLNQNEVYNFGFQIRALFPVRAEGTTSTAYEYYDSSVQAYDQLDGVEVEGESTRLRLDRESVRRPSSRRAVSDERK
jgi:CD109 antigen